MKKYTKLRRFYAWTGFLFLMCSALLLIGYVLAMVAFLAPEPRPATKSTPEEATAGTKVVIEGKEHVCEDRMARRYRDGEYYDIFMESKAMAYKHGRQVLNVLHKHE